MKLTQQLNFKVAPDDAIRDYKLPSDKKERRQMLTETGLCLKIKKLNKKHYACKIPKRFLLFNKRKISKIFGEFW
jgi:hypothetical protein